MKTGRRNGGAKRADPKPTDSGLTREGHLRGRGPPRRGRVSSAIPGSPAHGSYAGKQSLMGVLTTSGSKNHQRLHLSNLVRWKMAGIPDTLLKGPHTASLTCKHSPGLQWRGNNSRSTRDIPGKTIVWLWGKSWKDSSHSSSVEPA